MDKTMKRETIPERVIDFDAARETYGPLAERMVHFLGVRDPVADQVIAATRGWSSRELFVAVADAVRGVSARHEIEPLMSQITTVPAWVDFERIDRGATFFMSGHALSGLVLGARSLILGYAAPAGNKPLVLSGRLERNVNRRLAETSKFVYEVCRRGGLRPGADGVIAAAHVRLIHAKIRHMIDTQCDWDARWGEPINQHDMLATVLLFSSVLVEGLETLGLEPTPQEADDFIALWRYVGYLLGVDPELLPASRAEADRSFAFIDQTQAPPDDDARELPQAFLDAPASEPGPGDHESVGRPNIAVGYALARELLGDQKADQLAIPRTPLRLALPVVRRIVARLNSLRKWVPGNELADRGEAYWEWILENQPSGAVELTLPVEMLRSSLRAA